MNWGSVFKNPITTAFISGVGLSVSAAIGDPQHFNLFDTTSLGKLASVAMAGGVLGALAHRMPTQKQDTDKAVVEALVNAYAVQVLQSAHMTATGMGEESFVGLVPAFGIQVLGKTVEEARKNASAMLRATITGRIIAGMPMATPDSVDVQPGAVSVTDPGTPVSTVAAAVVDAQGGK